MKDYLQAQVSGQALTGDEGGEKLYQGALKNFSPAIQEISKQDALLDLTGLDNKMRKHLQWSDTKLLWCLLVFLETQTWAKQSRAPVSDSDNKQHIAAHLRLSLEPKGVSIFTLQGKVEEAVEYAQMYLDINHTECQKVWYKLYTCPDA